MTRGVLRAADDRSKARGDAWGTPSALFRRLDEEFRFTVDGAAIEENAKLPRFWSPKEDGLAQDWTGERVWVNPPFSQIGPWVKKAAERRAAVAVLLVPSRTGTGWWHEHGQHADEIRWIKGRVRFAGAFGNFPEDCCLLVFEGAP